MKRIIFNLAVLATLSLLLTSCPHFSTDRTVRVRLPQHPWENVSGEKLWYTLRWTDGQRVNALHVNKDERIVDLDIPIGQTVFVAAYPLGEMSPFGAAITPLDGSDEIVLTQDDGVLIDMLIDVDPVVIGMINYGLLFERIKKKVNDIRELEDVSLLKDIQNGELSESSLKVLKPFVVGPFALSNGIWESEFLKDPSLVVSDEMGGPVNLPPGVFRYLNVEDRMVLVLIVDRDGNFYSYLKRFSC